jgi:hypothetical protein
VHEKWTKQDAILSSIARTCACAAGAARAFLIYLFFTENGTAVQPVCIIGGAPVQASWHWLGAVGMGNEGKLTPPERPLSWLAQPGRLVTFPATWIGKIAARQHLESAGN